MKKLLFTMSILLAWATSLSAQITREQANEIVLQYIKTEITLPYLLYVNVNTPSEEGIAVTTFQEEVFNAKYTCWAYYLNENPELTEPARHRYLFVKENDGNLLEVITNNDLCPEDLTQWTEVTPTGLVDVEGNNGILIYPNPTSGQLTIDYGQLTIENVEIFDMLGKSVGNVETRLITSPQSETGQSGIALNISHLPSGVYFVKIKTENGIAVRKVVKN
jgi:hypothetical protein